MENNESLICLIEDNKAILRLLAMLLKKSGFTPVEFSEGKSALEWLSSNSPVCVVVDILLPDLSGVDIMESIRQMPDGNQIPVIAVTGLAQVQDRELLMSMGFDGYLSKPITTSTFAESIKQFMEQKKYAVQ